MFQEIHKNNPSGRDAGWLLGIFCPKADHRAVPTELPLRAALSGFTAWATNMTVLTLCLTHLLSVRSLTLG